MKKSIKDSLTEFYEHESKNNLETAKLYFLQVKKFLNHFDKELYAVTQAEFDEYVKEKPVSSINFLISSLKSYYSFHGKYPGFHLEFRKRLPFSREIMTEEQVQDFFKAFDERYEKQFRDKVLFLLIYHGIRIDDVRALRWPDFNEETGVLRVPSGFQIVLPADVAETLFELFAFQYPDELIFFSKKNGILNRKSIWRLFKVYAKRAKLPESITANSLRISRIIHLIRQGVPEENLLQLTDCIQLTDCSRETVELYQKYSKKNSA